MLIIVTGTGTAVGKTYVSAAVIALLRARGVTCAARKPAQSYDSDDTDPRDADVLAAATGEEPRVVCREDRWYPIALAPPMATTQLGRPRFSISELVAEIAASDAKLTFLEGAGGLRSPIAHDGDTLSLIVAMHPAHVVVVAESGLGTINAVRLTVDALSASGFEHVTVMLNRYDNDDTLHLDNANWLADCDGLTVVRSIDALVDALLGAIADH